MNYEFSILNDGVADGVFVASRHNIAGLQFSCTQYIVSLAIACLE
jgi:hypothetical protein